MSEKRFVVIDKAGDSWVRDTKTGLEYWDFFYSVEDASSFADTFNAAKYPDLVLKLRGSVLDTVIDDTLSELVAPLEQRIAELEAQNESHIKIAWMLRNLVRGMADHMPIVLESGSFDKHWKEDADTVLSRTLLGVYINDPYSKD